ARAGLARARARVPARAGQAPGAVAVRVGGVPTVDAGLPVRTIEVFAGGDQAAPARALVPGVAEVAGLEAGRVGHRLADAVLAGTTELLAGRGEDAHALGRLVVALLAHAAALLAAHLRGHPVLVGAGARGARLLDRRGPAGFRGVVVDGGSVATHREPEQREDSDAGAEEPRTVGSGIVH